METLKKHIGITIDNHGCEFEYTCYQEENLNDNSEFETTKTYVDNFFGNEASTLKELKNIMSKN